MKNQANGVRTGFCCRLGIGRTSNSADFDASAMHEPMLGNSCLPGKLPSGGQAGRLTLWMLYRSKNTTCWTQRNWALIDYVQPAGRIYRY